MYQRAVRRVNNVCQNASCIRSVFEVAASLGGLSGLLGGRQEGVRTRRCVTSGAQRGVGWHGGECHRRSATGRMKVLENGERGATGTGAHVKCICDIMWMRMTCTSATAPLSMELQLSSHRYHLQGGSDSHPWRALLLVSGLSNYSSKTYCCIGT
ncbi:hypothetical protein GN956_G14724 [Arapaima gigas]